MLTAGLAARLRAVTADAHQAAEGAPFIRALFRGEVERVAYGEFLRALHEVYAALEAGLIANRGDARVAPLVRPEVFREAALAADLAWFEVASAPPRAATKRYVEHLQRMTACAPHLLIAHAYTRTLGDLSGGQLLRRLVQERFGLTGVDGVRFYDFPIAQLGAYKHDYRAALDGLPLTLEEREQVVTEAVRAFELNTALVGELSTTI